MIDSISTTSLSSSLVWFIHDRQIVMQMADDMMELCKMNGDEEEEDGQGEEEDNYAERRTSSSLSVNVQAGAPRPSQAQASLTDYLLSGQAAEEAGMWLVAAKAIITLVCNSCRYSAALLSDLQDAHGYDVLKYIIRYSSAERRPDALLRLAQLVGK